MVKSSKLTWIDLVSCLAQKWPNMAQHYRKYIYIREYFNFLSLLLAGNVSKSDVLNILKAIGQSSCFWAKRKVGLFNKIQILKYGAKRKIFPI